MLEFKRSIEVTVDDYIYFNKSHYTKYRMKQLYVWLFALILILLVSVSVFTNPQRLMSPSFSVLLFLIIIVLSTTLVWITYFIILRPILTLINTLFGKWAYNNGVKHKRGELLLNDRGIQSETDKTSFFVVWDQISKIVESEYGFYLYYESRAAFIFPKRYLTSEEELSEFKGLLKNYTHKNITFQSVGKI